MRTTTFIFFRVVVPPGSIYPAIIVRLLRPHFAVMGPGLFGVGALYASAFLSVALAAGYRS